MGEHLERARQIAHTAAATTDVWVKLVTLQGLIHEIETLQFALADEMHKNEPKAAVPQNVGEVLNRRKPQLVKPEEPEEQKP